MANISAIKLPDNTTYNIRAGAIPYGEVDSTSTSTAFTATVPGINELVDGTIMMLHNGVVTSASGFKININGLGAKKCYNNLTNATQDTTIFNVAYTMVFIYSESLDSGKGGWWLYRGYDANTNTIGYQLRGNNGTRPAADKGYKYRLWLSSLDNQSWVPINTSTATDATTSRSLNSRVIDPFGEIVYYAYNGTTNAAANLTATTIWQQYTLTIGYSYVKSLTAWDPVYLKCEPQTGGGAVMKDIVQALPSTADGFIYIYLGIAYSATAMELRFYHPVYYHDGTGIRTWTGIKVPTKTSELTNNSNFVSDANYVHTDNNFTDAQQTKLAGIATGAEVNVQSDWNVSDSTSDAYIKNKPTIPSKTSDLSNDSGFITSYTETDPIFTASPAHGITASDISNWNGKSDFSGSYNDLADKPIYFGTCPTAETETVKIVTLDDADGFSLEAGAKIAVSFDSRHNPYVSTPKLNVNNTGVRDIVFPQIGYPTTSITELCGWSQYETVYFKYTGSKWLMFTSSMAMSILFQRDELRADWEETDNSSLSYIDNKPNVPVRVYGTTQTKTPTEVKEALSDGNIVEIAHEDQTFSFLTFFSFNYSWAFRLLISNTLVDYQGSTYLYTLVGNTNNDTWSGSATPMAKLSDIPTVPTNVSSFTNDAGYLTSYTETDPTVPAWAKASTKPSYTASEVGALPTSGGQLTGDLTLYVASGNSPGLIFQRGTLTDNFNDWKIYDKSGFLYFAQRGSGSSDFADMGYFNTSGVAYFHVPWSYIDSKPTFATVATSGSYNDLTDKPSNATQSQAGLMSAIDKQKLDALLVITQDSESGEVTIGTGASQNQNGEVAI